MTEASGIALSSERGIIIKSSLNEFYYDVPVIDAWARDRGRVCSE